ncbi:cytochrome P450 [Scleroderma yunnanense]
MGSPVDKYCEMYGPIVNFRFLFENRILATEPEHIKVILPTQFKSFERGSLHLYTVLGAALRELLHALLGTGVFNSDETWKFHRSMTRPFFSKDRISRFDIFEVHVEDAINQVKNRLQEGYPVDLQRIWSTDSPSTRRLSFYLKRMFARSLQDWFIQKNYPLSHDPAYTNHPANAFFHALLEVQSLTAYRDRFRSFRPLVEYWSDRVARQVDVCYKSIDPILKEALEKNRLANDSKTVAEKTNAEREVVEGEPLPEHLVNETDDPIVIRDEILNIMIAGRDTLRLFTCFMHITNPPDGNHPHVHNLQAVPTSRCASGFSCRDSQQS